MREVCADTEYLRGLDLLVEKPGQHQLHSGKSHMTRRRDIPQPWTWCPRQLCRPRGIRPDARAKPKREQHRTNPDCGTVYVPEQRSSGPRSHQAREDREVSRLGETKASHLVTKRSARSWLSRVRSCCWPYVMSALGRMGGRAHGNCLRYFCDKIISKLKIQPRIRREGGRTREQRHVAAWGLYLRPAGIVIGMWRSLAARA